MFDVAGERILADIKRMRKDADRSKTPKAGQGDGRKNRRHDPLANFMKENNIQKQFLRMGAGIE